jgi:hypothetical protein
LPHGLYELDPGDFWHHQVRQHQVDALGFQTRQSFPTVACGHDGESGSFQKTMNDAAQVDVVID